MDINKDLTEAEKSKTFDWIDQKQVDSSNVVGIAIQRTESQLEAQLLAEGRISKLTRKVLERRLLRKARKAKALRKRKPYTRKAGHVHPKKKEATKRRRRVRKWADDPYSCFINGWGFYTVSRDVWDKKMGPIWALYLPADLTIKRYRFSDKREVLGTRKCPFTIYSFDVVHSQLGKVYCGASEELYDLSKPEAVQEEA